MATTISHTMVANHNESRRKLVVSLLILGKSVPDLLQHVAHLFQLGRNQGRGWTSYVADVVQAQVVEDHHVPVVLLQLVVEVPAHVDVHLGEVVHVERRRWIAPEETVRKQTCPGVVSEESQLPWENDILGQNEYCLDYLLASTHLWIMESDSSFSLAMFLTFRRKIEEQIFLNPEKIVNFVDDSHHISKAGNATSSESFDPAEKVLDAKR